MYNGLVHAHSGLRWVVLVLLLAAILNAAKSQSSGRYVKKDKITHDNFALLENSGLYWHLVDAIWIFLFPLFYLIT